MGGQFLKLIFWRFWLQIQIPLEKVSAQTILLFQRFLWEHRQKYKKPVKIRVSLTYPGFRWFFTLLTVFLRKYLKKESSLCIYVFEKNLNLQSEFSKSELGKLTSHRDMFQKKDRTLAPWNLMEKSLLQMLCYLYFTKESRP